MNTILTTTIISGVVLFSFSIAIVIFIWFWKKASFDRRKIKFKLQNKINADRLLNEIKAKNKVFFSEKRKEIREKEVASEKKQHEINKNLNTKEIILKEQTEENNKLIKENKLIKTKLINDRTKLIKNLEEIANITQREAKEAIFENVEKKENKILNKLINEIRDKTEHEIKKIRYDIIASAVERYSGNFVEEHLTAGVLLENKELKGKIIGKDGRNIKSFESISGTDIIIDKDSNFIKISSFNPIRREIAVQALKSLIKDGRIQPERIEETLKKEKNNINQIIKEKGKTIVNALGITDMDKEMIYHIGKLKYRSSYGQNVLQHSVEVAKITGALAKELNLDDEVAIRAGLLHDIGKSIDYEIGKSHVVAGVELATEYNESKIVINAIHSHHGDVPPNNVYSVLVAAADTISAARPGARDNVQEDYLKRMETIEKICNNIDGIKESHVVKSGRVIRVIVDAIKFDDYETSKLCEEIKEKIKKEVQIPGEIKIIVIREKRFEAII